jgi:hypothetical protein
VREGSTGFEIWCHEYVRNESKAVSSAGQLRKLIAERIRQLRVDEGEILHAS